MEYLGLGRETVRQKFGAFVERGLKGPWVEV